MFSELLAVKAAKRYGQVYFSLPFSNYGWRYVTGFMERQ